MKKVPWDAREHASDTAEVVSRRETEVLVQLAVLSLPRAEREAVVLHYFLGEPLSYAGSQRNVLTSRRTDTLVATEYDGEARFCRDRCGRITHFVYYEFGRRLGVARRLASPPPEA